MYYHNYSNTEKVKRKPPKLMTSNIPLLKGSKENLECIKKKIIPSLLMPHVFSQTMIIKRRRKYINLNARCLWIKFISHIEIYLCKGRFLINLHLLSDNISYLTFRVVLNILKIYYRVQLLLIVDDYETQQHTRSTHRSIGYA